MNPSIPDFNQSELDTIQNILKKRYQRDIDLELADSEVRLDPSIPVLTLCPTIFWKIEKTNFVVLKTAAERYRCLFFYGDDEHYGTSIHEYDNIAVCMTTLLQVQADHALSERP